ncbi:DsbA family oxidoreductase [Amycolatopsis coloradensis]|uniref:DsbA family oxidoreductase n=1 Tax=Amycolatopsis coloradensis TaxID=76021 RepID=UPI0030F3BD8F
MSVNTLDAHRLNHLADQHGLGDRMHERLLKAHLCDGEIVDDLDTLVRLGTEVGVPEDEAREVLEGTKYAGEVDVDFAEARRIGVNGVPFFVLNGAYGVSGAQSAVTSFPRWKKHTNHDRATETHELTVVPVDGDHRIDADGDERGSGLRSPSRRRTAQHRPTGWRSTNSPGSTANT